MPTVVLLGTLDTKGIEYQFIRDAIQSSGVDTILIDAGVVHEASVTPDIPREKVAELAGTTIEALVAANDRGAAMDTMSRGATLLLTQLFEEGKLHGVIGLGGSGGTSLITRAMQSLPIGVPKLMISTVASGDTRPYVGAVDITMMYSIVDISGINSLSARILGNGAAAIAGMATAYASSDATTSGKHLIGATMFGVTTPAVTHARELLEQQGYEVLVFHATGTGGQSMEAMITSGFLAGVLDLTTTELADNLVGGVMSAGDDRLTGAGSHAVPQVVSLGALDMVNFGSMDSVPAEFQHRNLYAHNRTVTLMRTTAEECRQLGLEIASKLNAARGPVALFIPAQGISLISTDGEVFHDPEADLALFGALKDNLASHVVVHDLDLDINDPAFADAMVDQLLEFLNP